MPSDNKEQVSPVSNAQRWMKKHYDKPLCKPMWQQRGEALDDLEALITDQCRLARIDELSEIPLNPNFINEYIADRIKTLENKND